MVMPKVHYDRLDFVKYGKVDINKIIEAVKIYGQDQGPVAEVKLSLCDSVNSSMLIGFLLCYMNVRDALQQQSTDELERIFKLDGGEAKGDG